ncbi:MAG: addiction module toxin RelE [Nanoarchaeota archaeon]|nr:addiction module toxin RelE [Nanoarchaeota archaeon]
MRKFSVDERLRRTLRKLSKKDSQSYNALLSKMDEILSCSDVNHYKNLRRPLQHLKRVRIGSFVLTFRYDPAEDKVIFYSFEHHDNVYK